MKPVHQTRLGKNGNCFAACLASIMEVPLEAVPDAMDDLDSGGYCWLKTYNAWLAETFSLYLLNIARVNDLPGGAVCMASHMAEQAAYHLIGGKSERGMMHSVVAFQGNVVHDPNPDSTGLKSVVDYGFFMSLNPARTPSIVSYPAAGAVL